MITVIGSINMDLVVETPHIPAIGETILGTGFAQNPGGKGANQAVAAARLGSEVALVGCLGSDGFGDVLCGGLKENGVNIAPVRRCEGTSGIALIQVDEAGRNNIVVIPGSNYALCRADIDRAERWFAQSAVVLLQMEIPLDVLGYALERTSAAGCRTILNPAPAHGLTREMLRCTEILVPNEVELSALTQSPCKTEAEIRQAAEALYAQGISHIVVTLGERGVFYKGPDTARFYPANPVRAVDTTAAGDAFLGGFAHCLERGTSFETAICFGQKAAAWAVRHPGAQPSLPAYGDISL